MEVFNLTLSQMLMMFLFILFGFLLRKCKILPDSAELVLSRVETYIFNSGMILYSLMNNCTIPNFIQNSSLIFYGGITIFVCMAVALPLSKLFQKNYKQSAELSYQRNLYKYALTFGNYGFIGNFLVLSIWGSEGLFHYAMYTLVIALVCGCWGIYILVPKDENQSAIKNIMKGLLTMPVLSLFVGIILGFLNVKAYLPGFCLTLIENAANCYGPVAMLLTGVVIGGYDIKKLLTHKKTYILTLLRLIIIPSIIMIVYRLLGLDENVSLYALIAFSAPLGMGLIIYPAAYGADTRPGASMVLVSSVLATITIPLMYLVFMVWM